MKKFIATLVVGLAALAGATAADAHGFRGGFHHGDRGFGLGGAIVGGIIGGAIIGSQVDPYYVYPAPAPVYPYGCQPVWNGYQWVPSC